MKEALIAAALFAIALICIARVAKKPNGFVRRCSRSALMRELNEEMEEKLPGPGVNSQSQK